MIYRQQTNGRTVIDQIRERMISAWSHPLADATVSVVVPVWGALPQTVSCLASLTKYSVCLRQLIVVAQEMSSEDRTALQQITDDRLQVLERQEAVGFAVACNLGLAQAEGDFVAFVHSDVVVTPRWDMALLRPLFAAADIALTGPVALHGGNPVQTVKGPQITSEQQLVETAGNWMQQQQGHWQEVEALDSFCLMGRRADLHDVGGWSEEYAWGVSADLDLSLRMRRDGKRLIAAMDTLLHHQGGTTFQEHRLPVAVIQEGNRKILQAKWGGRQD